MAIMWSGSLVPWIDANGNPYAGAKLFFFDAETTTPRTVYRDGGQNESHDHPVVANGAGKFPAVFLQAGDYRERMETADGQVVHDVDLITAPNGEAPIPPDAGDTDPKLLASTGDVKVRHAVGTHAGWVRCNARTLGSAASGATERANADCEALFLHLWEQDPTLTVSGGRGANAASDWASNKNIALPDFRSVPLVGLASMGGATSTRLSGIAVDNGETLDTLGATLGVKEVAISIAQMPSHNHGGTTNTTGNHSHTYQRQRTIFKSAGTDKVTANEESDPTNTSSAGNHAHTISSQGGGGAHPNVQPSALITIYIKL